MHLRARRLSVPCPRTARRRAEDPSPVLRTLEELVNLGAASTAILAASSGSQSRNIIHYKYASRRPLPPASNVQLKSTSHTR